MILDLCAVTCTVAFVFMTWVVVTDSQKNEVVHGRWIDNGIPESMLSGCSVCGFSCGAYSFNYCPNCGAKMDGEE